MTEDAPKPTIKTVKIPTYEEIKASYGDYTSAVGAVAHVSNFLQERLGELFAIASGADRAIALAIWYSLSSDINQRRLLRAAVSASPDDRWMPRLPLAKSDLLWLVDRSNSFANHRNDAIHTPCSLFVSEEGHGFAAAFLKGNPKAMKLRGQEIVKEFQLCAAFAERLARFAEKIYSAFISSDYPWPDRPELPDLERKNGPASPSRLSPAG